MEAILRGARDTAVLLGAIAQSGLLQNRCAHGWWETTGKSLGSPLRQSCDGYAVYSRRLAEIDGEIEKYATQLKAKMELRGGPRPPGKTSAARQHLANRKPQGQGAFGGTRIPGGSVAGRHKSCREKWGRLQKWSAGAAAFAA